MREAVRKVPKRRRYAAVAILALFVMAATVTSATARTGKPHKAAFKAVIKATDSCGYPFGSGLTATTFNESTVLKGFSATALGTGTATVQEFYSDEWELNLGTAPIEQWDPTYATPIANVYADDAGTNPNNVGGSQPADTNATIGDGFDPQGRPDNPEIFVTDVTGTGHLANHPEAGDWQMGGTGSNPNFIAGTWKVNGQATHNTILVNGKAVNQANKTNLGPHADAFATNINTSIEGYGAESRWDVSTLHESVGGLAVKPGHTYKVQMMIHDGDHVSDTGEACRLVTIPKAPSATHTTPNVKITEDINLSIDTSTNATASVHAGDTVTVKLYQSVPTASSGTGCSATNQDGGTGATQRGSTNTITVVLPPDPNANFDPATGKLTATLTYPDDFGGANAPALTNGKYWWFVSYSGNDEVDGSNDGCTETFSLSSSLLPAAP
jgi:hypothetical protein